MNRVWAVWSSSSAEQRTRCRSSVDLRAPWKIPDRGCCTGSRRDRRWWIARDGRRSCRLAANSPSSAVRIRSPVCSSTVSRGIGRSTPTKAAQLAARGGHDAASGRRRGQLRRAVNDLAALLEVTRRIAGQTRQRLAATTPPGATRRVSLHEPDARPIATGQLGKPVQFGYRAQVVDNDDGVVLDHNLERGNPPGAAATGPGRAAGDHPDRPHAAHRHR